MTLSCIGLAAGLTLTAIGGLYCYLMGDIAGQPVIGDTETARVRRRNGLIQCGIYAAGYGLGGVVIAYIAGRMWP